jgi:DNA-nicking Smr family endonuclease
MQRGVSGSSRKGIPLDLWSAAAGTPQCQCPPANDDTIKTPWQTHRVGISQNSSAWSTSQPPAARHNSISHNHYASSAKISATNPLSSCDFPSLSTSKPAVTDTAAAKPECKWASVCSSSSLAAVQSTSTSSAHSALIRDCVKELRRLFPDADRDLLEDATVGIATSLKSDMCLGNLLEQVVSRLLDVFADNPGVRCAFPKFPVSQPVAPGEPATWKDKVGSRAVGKQKKKLSTVTSVDATRPSDMDFYRAAIESLTQKSCLRESEPQERAESKPPHGFYLESICGSTLRVQSHQIAASRAQLFAEAARAFIAGDSKLAKELSSRGHELTLEYRDLASAAAERIFQSKNQSLDEGVIDLHGLHRDEAFAAVSSFIEHLRLNPPSSSLGSPLVICGKGIHSKGAPVLQGTAKEALTAAGCTFHVLPGGTGTLVVTNW